MRRKHRRNGGFNGFLCSSPAAADADTQYSRREAQRFGKRFFRAVSDHNSQRTLRFFHNSAGQCTLDRKIAHKRYIALQNFRCDLFCKQHTRNGAFIFCCPGIGGKFTVHVRCRRDDRRCAERRGKAARQIVRPADMTGEQRNDKLHLLVDAEHRGIGLFAHKIRRDLTHGDTARADEDERIHRRKALAVDVLRKRQKARFFQSRYRVADGFRLRQHRANAPRCRAAAVAVGKNCDLHAFPLRYSVVKSGW